MFPSEIRNGASKWMAGRCFEMALVLSGQTKLPIYGLWDDTKCHHAFVYDEELDIAIDARGLISIDALKRGCAGQAVKPLSLAELKDCMERSSFPDKDILHKDEIREAKKYIKDVLEGRDGDLLDQLDAMRENSLPKM